MKFGVIPSTNSETISSMNSVLECRRHGISVEVYYKKCISAVGTKQIGQLALKHKIQHKIMASMCRAYGTYKFSNNFSTECHAYGILEQVTWKVYMQYMLMA